MSKPKISIIFPTYNRQYYLKETLDSIFSQKFEDFEICVLDHGSGPATAALLKTYKDLRLKTWRYEENRAPGVLCPFCFLGKKAKGEYFVLFSDDDRMLPDYLQKRVEILDAHLECGFVFSSVEMIDNKGRRIGKSDFNQPKQCDSFNAAPFNQLFVGNRIVMPSVMFRREYMKYFEQPFGVLNDWAFWLEIASRTKSAWLSNPTLEYRMWDGSDSKINGGKGGEFLQRHPQIWKRWMNAGHRPSVMEYENMKKKMELMAAQQIAFLKEEFPPKIDGKGLLNLLS